MNWFSSFTGVVKEFQGSLVIFIFSPWLWFRDLFVIPLDIGASVSTAEF